METQLATGEPNPSHPLHNFLMPFRHSRTFPFLWFGQLISILGSSITTTILPLVVLSLTGSTFSSGMILSVYMLFNVIALPVSGYMVDRYDRIKLLLFSNVVRFLLMAATATFMFTDLVNMAILYTIVGLYGLMDGIFQPAYAAVRAQVFTPDIRNAANAVTQLGNQGVRLIGPTLGGLLLTVASAGYGFGVDALTYVISFGCLLMLRRRTLQAVAAKALRAEQADTANSTVEEEIAAAFTDGGEDAVSQADGTMGIKAAADELPQVEPDGTVSAKAVAAPLPLPQSAASGTPETTPGKAAWKQDIIEGVRILRGHPWLWITILAFSFVNICFSGISGVLIPWLFKIHHGFDPRFYGYAVTCSGVGAILAALLFGSRPHWRHRGLLAYGGAMMSGVALLLMTVVPSAPGLCALYALEGFGLMMFGLIWETSLQELVPPEAFGRVASLDMLGSFALLPLGYILIGWLADDAIGGIATMALFSSIGLVTLIAFLTIPAIRRFQ